MNPFSGNIGANVFHFVFIQYSSCLSRDAFQILDRKYLPNTLFVVLARPAIPSPLN
jgi:hypothetical protein